MKNHDISKTGLSSCGVILIIIAMIQLDNTLYVFQEYNLNVFKVIFIDLIAPLLYFIIGYLLLKYAKNLANCVLDSKKEFKINAKSTILFTAHFGAPFLFLHGLLHIISFSLNFLFIAQIIPIIQVILAILLFIKPQILFRLNNK